MENINKNVLYSSVSYRRNLSEIPFTTKGIDSEMAFALSQSLSEIFSDEVTFKSLKNIPYEDCLTLLDNEIINKKILINKDISFYGVSEDFIKQIYINEEDHVKILIKNKGYCLEHNYNMANEMDDKLLENLNVCFNKEYGFLTVDPLNMGCGLTLECLLFIPAICQSNVLEKIKQELLGDCFTIEKYIDCGEKFCPLFIVRNKYSFGMKENELANSFDKIIKGIVNIEQNEENKIFEMSASRLTDNIFRTYGIATNSYRISFEECVSLLCYLQWGIDLNILKKKNSFNLLEIISKIRDNQFNKEENNVKDIEKYRSKFLTEKIQYTLKKGDVDV